MIGVADITGNNAGVATELICKILKGVCPKELKAFEGKKGKKVEGIGKFVFVLVWWFREIDIYDSLLSQMIIKTVAEN